MINWDELREAVKNYPGDEETGTADDYLKRIEKEITEDKVSKNVDIYQMKRLLAYAKLFTAYQRNSENMKNISEYLQERINQVQNEKAIIMKDYFENLEKCYSNRAYTATLVMAGAILESFLISWLEETYEHFYDENDNLFIRNRGQEYKLSSLSDYIYQIRFIDTPRWMSDGFNDKATRIRKKRNLLHTLLCLKEDEEVNRNLCDEVISYLNEIIEEKKRLDSEG